MFTKRTPAVYAPFDSYVDDTVIENEPRTTTRKKAPATTATARKPRAKNPAASRAKAAQPMSLDMSSMDLADPLAVANLAARYAQLNASLHKAVMLNEQNQKDLVAANEQVAELKAENDRLQLEVEHQMELFDTLKASTQHSFGQIGLLFVRTMAVAIPVCCAIAFAHTYFTL